MNKLKYLYLFLFLIFVASVPVESEASQVDFGWSVPGYFLENDGSEDEKKYLIWVFSNWKYYRRGDYCTGSYSTVNRYRQIL